jgi:hypothetical protein
VEPVANADAASFQLARKGHARISFIPEFRKTSRRELPKGKVQQGQMANNYLYLHDFIPNASKL